MGLLEDEMAGWHTIGGETAEIPMYHGKTLIWLDFLLVQNRS